MNQVQCKRERGGKSSGSTTSPPGRAPVLRSTPEVITADRRAVPKHEPLWVTLACEALEAAGFRIARNTEELGRYLLIECLLPSALRGDMSANNPNYEIIMRHQVSLAWQCIKRAGVDAEKITSYGWRLVIWLPMSKKRTRAGRPREEGDLVQQVRSLREAGCTWVEIAKRIQQCTGISRTPDSYRKLFVRTQASAIQE